MILGSATPTMCPRARVRRRAATLLKSTFAACSMRESSRRSAGALRPEHRNSRLEPGHRVLAPGSLANHRRPISDLWRRFCSRLDHAGGVLACVASVRVIIPSSLHSGAVLPGAFGAQDWQPICEPQGFIAI